MTILETQAIDSATNHFLFSDEFKDLKDLTEEQRKAIMRLVSDVARNSVHLVKDHISKL